ncbi:MAG TPA: hypothetical protein VHW24_20765 [Bryobacteraceae bacterium]|nr:hypothetical protein [Bryobacteraceae bacterium]
MTRLAQELLGVIGQFQPEFHLAIFRNIKADVQPDWKEKTVAFLKKYDVAPATPPQVHYTAYLIRASRKAGSSGDGALPKDVQEAVNEMKRSLPYVRYDLATVVTNVSEGGAESSDALPSAGRPEEAGVGVYYNIQYGRVSVSQDRKAISIRPFHFWTRGPSGNKDDVMASISSDVTIHEGQKLVLGKLRLNGDDDLFIILTAKVE